MTGTLNETVQTFYRLLAAGQLDEALGLLDPNIAWQTAAGFPTIGGLHHGVEAVKNNVFARLAAEWTTFAVVPERWIVTDAAIVVLGRYQGTYPGSSRSLNAPFVHIWDSTDSRITHFTHVSDTGLVRDAMQP